MITSYEERRRDLMLHTAESYWKKPLLDSGLWDHGDIRNNFYAASYLIAAASDSALEVSFDREEAIDKASGVLLLVMSLQDRNPTSPSFGHWPLGLHPDPQLVTPNPLPVELMGTLMVYFFERFEEVLPVALKEIFVHVAEAMYRSSYYKAPMQLFNHHEAKYTATKLIFGYRFGDEALLESGVRCLRETLARVQEKGMPEYGALPWFWHWIQAFICAYECIPIDAIRADLAALLDELWQIRAISYLKGAWAGGRMRSLSHDLPRDRNVGFDYVQFGDFPLPVEIPRMEFAGLLFYEVNDSTRHLALNQKASTETKTRIVSADPSHLNLNAYLYRSGNFATGGVWERVNEFDNEQHRWEVTFPLTEEGNVNRIYFFRPGAGYSEGDPRHESEGCEVLFHRNAILALYPNRVESGELIGVLPKGQWIYRDDRIYGFTYGVYVAVFLRLPYTVREEPDHITVVSQGSENGVVVEVIGSLEAAYAEIGSLKVFESIMDNRSPVWHLSDTLSVEYVMIDKDQLRLSVITSSLPDRSINGQQVRFESNN